MEAAEQICKGKLAFILFRTGRDKCLGNPDLEVFSLFFWSLLLLLFLWLEGGGDFINYLHFAVYTASSIRYYWLVRSSRTVHTARKSSVQGPVVPREPSECMHSIVWQRPSVRAYRTQFDAHQVCETR